MQETLQQLPLPPPPNNSNTRTRSHHQTSTRRVTPTRDQQPSVVVAKVLPNGDLYTGGFSWNVPHGKGKYVWSDGCMYEGEWKRGKAYGQGKFSWPSGATYQGHFKSGRMDGEGTFIGVDGDTYKGSWNNDRKHGYGEKRYANGDVYEGLWKFNLMDGHGKYTWSDGNVYLGEWKNGVIFGKGVLSWSNGNRYEGYWENGLPKGKGVFTWSNTRNENVKNEEKEKGFEVMGGRKRSSVDRPRLCIWELNGEAGDITCDIVDNVEAASRFYKDGRFCNQFGGVGVEKFQRSPCGSAGTDDDIKKPGQTISKGHKNYDLMLNLQLGIR